MINFLVNFNLDNRIKNFLISVRSHADEITFTMSFYNYFVFEWEARIGHRNDCSDCPFLSGRLVWKGYNDLATNNPQLAAQWHPEKNGDLTPEMVTPSSGRKVWWKLKTIVTC